MELHNPSYIKETESESEMQVEETLPKAERKLPEVFNSVRERKVGNPETGPQFTVFEFPLQKGNFEIIFKSEEDLADPEIFKGKEVVMFGNLPYARNSETIEQYFVEAEQNAEHFLAVRHAGKFEMSSSFHASVGLYEVGDGNPFRLQNIKPNSSINNLGQERIRNNLKESIPLFVVNSDIETILEYISELKDLFPELKEKKSALPNDSIDYLQDLVAASSIDENGKLQQNIALTRRLLFEALMGNEKSADELLSSYYKNKDKIPTVIEHSTKRQILYLKELLQYSNGDERVALEREIEKNEIFLDKIKRGEVIEVPPEVVEELDKYVAIHMTRYYPFFDEKNNSWKILPNSTATGNRGGRLSVHFSLDGMAAEAGVGIGEWDKMPYAIVAPLGQMIKRNGPMECLMPADTWWLNDPNNPGVNLPENATIVRFSTDPKLVKDKPDDEKDRMYHEDFQKSKKGLDHQAPHNNVEQVTTRLDSESFLRRLLSDKYKVKYEGVGKDNWLNAPKVRLWQLADEVNKIYPAVHGERHWNSLSGQFEQVLLNYYESVILAENQDIVDRKSKEWNEEFQYAWVVKRPREKVIQIARQKVIDSINRKYFKNNGDPDFDIDAANNLPREFARQLVKSGII